MKRGIRKESEVLNASRVATEFATCRGAWKAPLQYKHIPVASEVPGVLVNSAYEQPPTVLFQVSVNVNTAPIPLPQDSRKPPAHQLDLSLKGTCRFLNHGFVKFAARMSEGGERREVPGRSREFYKSKA